MISPCIDGNGIDRKFSSKEDTNIKLTTLFKDLCKHYHFKDHFISKLIDILLLSIIKQEDP
jgi:hypothetical protein